MYLIVQYNLSNDPIFYAGVLQVFTVILKNNKNMQVNVNPDIVSVKHQ